MNILLDTNLLITGLRPESLSRFQDARFYTSSLCYAELSEGQCTKDAAGAVRAALQLERARALLGPGLAFGDSESQVYRIVCQAVVGAGMTLGRVRRVDLMIAATAVSNDLALGTRNVKDYLPLRDILSVIEL